MMFDYMPLGPAQAFKRSDGQHVVSAVVNHVVLPADVARNVSVLFVRLTLGASMEKTTRAGKPMQSGQLNAAQKKALEDVIRRLHGQGVAPAATAAAVGLRVEQVEAVCRHEEVDWRERQDPATSGSTTYNLKAALHFVTGDEVTLETPLRVELLKAVDGKAWMEARSTLGAVLALHGSALSLAGGGTTAELQLKVALRPLAADSPREPPGCFPSALGCFKSATGP